MSGITAAEAAPLEASIREVLLVLFEMPDALGMGVYTDRAGAVHHTWPLAPDEAHRLSHKMVVALSTLPAKSLKVLEKYLEKFWPWGALAWTAYAIVNPRIEVTRELIALERERLRNAAQQPGEARAAAGAHS